MLDKAEYSAFESTLNLLFYRIVSYPISIFGSRPLRRSCLPSSLWFFTSEIPNKVDINETTWSFCRLSSSLFC